MVGRPIRFFSLKRTKSEISAEPLLERLPLIGGFEWLVLEDAADAQRAQVGGQLNGPVGSRSRQRLLALRERRLLLHST